MPWILPVGDVPGRFMSPCASNQMSPSFFFSDLRCAEMPETVPIAMEWSPPITSGHSPASNERFVISASCVHTSRISSLKRARVSLVFRVSIAGTAISVSLDIE